MIVYNIVDLKEKLVKSYHSYIRNQGIGMGYLLIYCEIMFRWLYSVVLFFWGRVHLFRLRDCFGFWLLLPLCLKIRIITFLTRLFLFLSLLNHS